MPDNHRPTTRVDRKTFDQFVVLAACYMPSFRPPYLAANIQELTIDKAQWEQSIKFLARNYGDRPDVQRFLVQWQAALHLSIQFPPDTPQDLKDAILNRAKKSLKAHPPKNDAEAYRRVAAIAEELGMSSCDPHKLMNPPEWKHPEA
jgi:hypothetical protein